MSRYVSFNAREAGDASASDQIEVVLVIVEHPDLAEPERLSSDNKVRLSVEPLQYGTLSSWRTQSGEPFRFIGMGAQLPDDADDGPANGSLVVELHDQRLVDALRSTVTPATIHMALVMADTPDLVEAEFVGMELAGADIGAGEATLQFGLKPVLAERNPSDRMTRQQFPGLHP